MTKKQYKFPPEPFTSTQWMDLNGLIKTASNYNQARKTLKALGYEYTNVPHIKVLTGCADGSEFRGKARYIRVYDAKLWRRSQSTVTGNRDAG